MQHPLHVVKWRVPFLWSGLGRVLKIGDRVELIRTPLSPETTFSLIAGQVNLTIHHFRHKPILLFSLI